jgi:hypothetical protein
MRRLLRPVERSADKRSPQNDQPSELRQPDHASTSNTPQPQPESAAPIAHSTFPTHDQHVKLANT